MAGILSLLERINIIKRTPVFAGLNWFDLQKIARKSTIVEYKKGVLIRKEGDEADYFYCLVSGRVQQYNLHEGNEKRYIDFIHRGMYFGIISVLTDESHSQNYETLNDSIILQISKEDFRILLKDIPRLGIEFSRSLSKRLRSKHVGKQAEFESQIIAVYSPVTGVGSSTYASHLAVHLQKETNKKVILVNI
jgi:CRP-like cAMP-binding protein